MINEIGQKGKDLRKEAGSELNLHGSVRQTSEEGIWRRTSGRKVFEVGKQHS